VARVAAAAAVVRAARDPVRAVRRSSEHVGDDPGGARVDLAAAGALPALRLDRHAARDDGPTQYRRCRAAVCGRAFKVQGTPL
jgi:hypothetical protein